MRCDALNFGSPSMTRCSQVTWFRSSLLKTPQIQRGFFHCRQYFATVISSAMLFICIAPSPTTAMTGRSGCANLAAIAYGTAAPIDAFAPAMVGFLPQEWQQGAQSFGSVAGEVDLHWIPQAQHLWRDIDLHRPSLPFLGQELRVRET